VAATTTFVPPLVMPGSRPRIQTAATPSSPVAVSPPARPPAAASPSGSRTAESRSAAPVFKSISVHAADPANVREGARVIDCASCDGGQRVGYIGGPNILVMRVNGVTVAGSRTLTVTYESDGPRTLQLTVNNGAVRTLSLAGAHDLLIPAVVTLQVFIPTGTSWIKFANDGGPAPDINKIVIS
jgi:hypothetical protein